MDEKIDLGLFARLMRFSAATRKDFLEYAGQGPVSLRGIPLDGPVAAPEKDGPAPDQPKLREG